MGRVVGNVVLTSRGLGPVWSPPSEGRKLNLKETLVLSPGGGYKQRFHRALTNKPRAPSGPGGERAGWEKHWGEKQPCLFRKPDAVCFSRAVVSERGKPDAGERATARVKGLVFWSFPWSVWSRQRVSSKVKLELIWLQSDSRAKGPITASNPGIVLLDTYYSIITVTLFPLLCQTSCRSCLMDHISL